MKLLQIISSAQHAHAKIQILVRKTSSLPYQLFNPIKNITLESAPTSSSEETLANMQHGFQATTSAQAYNTQQIDENDTQHGSGDNSLFFQTRQDLMSFESSFASFVEDIVNCPNLLRSTNCDNLTDNESNCLTLKQVERIHKVFYYTVPHGKMLRPFLFISVYKHLNNDEITNEDLQKIYKIGWIFETNHSFACLMDDIMDQGTTRHGRPCWQMLPDVGPQDAIIDGLTLEHSYLLLLQNYMGGQPYCLDILKLFHETNYQTTLGQQLDILTAKSRDMTEYNMKLYTNITTNKTGLYTFYNPIAAGLLMNGINNTNILTLVKKLSGDMSMLFQIQDDYLDCFGDLSRLGKGGNDIQEGKCSWPIVKALENASPAQKKILLENYGIANQKNISQVKRIYEDIGISCLFLTYENSQHESILEQIHRLPSFMPRALLTKVVDRLCKRLY